MAIVSFRADDSTVEKIDSLANAMDRNRTYVINEALESYLEFQEWRLQRIREGIADVEAGRTVTYEQFKLNMDAFIEKTKAQLASAKETKLGKVGTAKPRRKAS